MASELILDRHGFDRVDIQEEFRNSADYALKADCLSELQSTAPPDVVILLSGDKGFTHLVEHLRFAGKHVIVIGRWGVTSQRLAQAANGFHYAEVLCQAVS